VVQPTKPENVDGEDNNVPGICSKVFLTLIPETVQKGWNMWWKSVTDGSNEFTDEILESTNGILNADKIGDWASSKFGEMFEIMAKANVRRQLGDCGRLWSQVRRMNLFSSNNAYGPVNPAQMVGNTYPDGTAKQPINNLRPTAADADPNIRASADALKAIKVEATKK
jgi:hypothetical protein